MMSFIGGALAGAAAMYLLDPEMGERRRKMIASQAGDCMEGTTDMLQSGWDKVSDYAGGWGHTLADKAHQYGSSLSGMAHDTASGLTTRASSLADIRDNLTDYSKSLWKQVRGTGQDISNRARRQPRSYLGEQRSPIIPVTLTAIGCCVIGAGVMYIADPRLGRARRAWFMDKSRSMANRTGKSFYRTGRHMANKAKGVVAETRGAAQDLVERINNSLRGMLKDPTAVQVSSDVSGAVTLVGRLATEQCDRVLRTIESIPGVTRVVNRIETFHPNSTQRNQSIPQM
jgi:gas vesicle protein